MYRVEGDVVHSVHYSLIFGLRLVFSMTLEGEVVAEIV